MKTQEVKECNPVDVFCVDGPVNAEARKDARGTNSKVRIRVEFRHASGEGPGSEPRAVLSIVETRDTPQPARAPSWREKEWPTVREWRDRPPAEADLLRQRRAEIMAELGEEKPIGSM